MCSTSFLTNLFSGNAIVCSDTFKESLTADAVQQQVDTLNNTQANYSDPLVLQVAQNAEQAAINAVPDDVSSILSDMASSDVGSPFLNPACNGFDFTSIGFGCLSKDYIYLAVAIIAGLILLSIFTNLKSLTGV